jgi:hypothetical protein
MRCNIYHRANPEESKFYMLNLFIIIEEKYSTQYMYKEKTLKVHDTDYINSYNTEQSKKTVYIRIEL